MAALDPKNKTRLNTLIVLAFVAMTLLLLATQMVSNVLELVRQ